MNMKRTDLEKNMAKKLESRMKFASTPARFAEGAASAATRKPSPVASAPKLVAVACRLPASLVNRLRTRAAAESGGLNAVMAQAVESWLDAQTPAT